MAAPSPSQSRAMSLGVGVRNAALPTLQTIFDPRSMERSLDAYVARPIGQPMVDVAGALAGGAADVLTAGGKVPAGIGPLYTGLTGLGEFSEGLLFGEKDSPKTPTSTMDKGYKPGLYAPGPMSSIYDEPVESEAAPAPNPYDPMTAFIPGPPPSSGVGVGPAPPMRPVPSPFDPSTFPAAPQRAPLDQNVDPYFAAEEKSLEAAKPTEPHFDNQTLIMRALAGAAIGAALGGDIGSAFAGGITGLTTGMERRETAKEKFARELEAYHLRRAGFESKKGTYKANLAERQGDVDYSNAAAKYQRDIEVERTKRSLDDRRDDIIWQNRRDAHAYQSDLAKAAAESAKEMRPKYSMSDGVLYMQQYRPPANGQPGGMEVRQIPLDPLLHDVERRAKVAKATKEITGISGEQSVALNPTKIELPPEKRYVGDAVVVTEMNSGEEIRGWTRAAEAKVLQELNMLPEGFEKMTEAEQDQAIRNGKNMILEQTGDIKQFEEIATKKRREAMVSFYWVNEEAGREAASRRIRP